MTKHHRSKPPTEIEAKTTWATYAAFVFSAITAAVVADPSIVDGAPAWVRALVALITGTGAVRLAAFNAPHTDRSDTKPRHELDTTTGDLDAEAAAYQKEAA